MTNLPDKLWGLIEIAKVDAFAIADNPLYELNMGPWHAPSIAKPVCRVCLAGAVMANSLGACWNDELRLSHYPDLVQRKLLALNAFRAGDYRDALGALYKLDDLPTEVIDFADCEDRPDLHGYVSKAELEAFFEHPTVLQFVALLKEHDL